MTDVTIWNLALGHLGDAANVVSPDERSRQAELCRRYYPLVRRSLLEMHDWSFASRRAFLALAAANPSTSWAYAYQRPEGAIRILEVGREVQGRAPWAAASTQQLSPVPYAQETAADGSQLILNTEAELKARFIVDVTDSAQWSPLFVETFAYLLASKLAGPLITGEAGRAESRRLLDEFRAFLGTAETFAANQQRVQQALYDNHIPTAVRGRDFPTGDGRTGW